MLEQLQDAWLSRLISESTWGYPIVGALHVLALALFGGAVLIAHLQTSDLDARWIRRVGVALIVVTGALLFASGAVRYYASTSFRIKIALLALIVLNDFVGSRRQHKRLHSAISLGLWAGGIFSSRGIAFF